DCVILAMAALFGAPGAVPPTARSITGTTSVLAGSSYDARSGTISAHLAGSGDLTKPTAATVTFAAANPTWTGSTFVNAGTLIASANGALASGPLTVSGGTLDVGA